MVNGYIWTSQVLFHFVDQTLDKSEKLFVCSQTHPESLKEIKPMNIASNVQTQNKIFFFVIHRGKLKLKNLFHNVLQRLHRINKCGSR